MKLGYLINQYPMASLTFIRKEIAALESNGYEVQRYAIQPWPDKIVDSKDKDEQSRTRYLKTTIPLVGCFFLMCISRPLRMLQAMKTSYRVARRSDRSWVHHLAYLAEACRLCRWVELDRIQHLHIHFATNSTEVGMLCHLLGGMPYSFTVHGPEEFDRASMQSLDAKVACAQFVAAISQFGRSQIYRWTRFEDWTKIHVIHCGLDATYLDREHPPVVSSYRFVCVGRLCEQKGQLLLVEAFAKLVKAWERSNTDDAGRLTDGTLRESRYAESSRVAEVAKTSGPRELFASSSTMRELSASSATKNSTLAEFARIQSKPSADEFARIQTPELVLVGDGPMRSQIEFRIRELGIEEYVRITGWASGETVQKEIADARAMVLPSFAEGLPVVIMEALAMERPVISTYIAGIPELVIPGENGWLVPAGDVDALVEAMKQAIEIPVDRLQEMGRAGRARVLERHNIKTEVAKLAELFKTNVKR